MGVHYSRVASAVDRGEVEIIAPAGFLSHAVSENLYAGVAMARRAAYMYGAELERGPEGSVGAGLGHTTSTGEVGVIPPTREVTQTGETIVVDGVEIEFQLAPDSEAPAEFHFYYPQYRALCIAENATHTLHNVLTLRGALVRDSRSWAGYLTEAVDRYGERSDVVFASHHWPTWGAARVCQFLERQRDIYAYLHDETLCQAPGFVEAHFLGFLSSRGLCRGLVDPFRMNLERRAVANR
nr:MBL fold metallo-hydrolase [Brevibacterium oceani]